MLENLALRQWILVLQRRIKRPELNPLHRLFWCWLARIWKEWKTALVIVQPDTVVSWQCQSFRWFWRWKSRRRSGRQPLDQETRRLIRTMSQTNPLWGAPRIHGELLRLGIRISQRTVAKYMVPRSERPSSTWKSFLRNHISQMVSVDFFTVPTVTFRVLYVFLVFWHERRKVLHFHITDCPSSVWVAQQLREAFPFVNPLQYLLRDRDCIFGMEFRRRVSALDLKEVLIAPRCPWQSRIRFSGPPLVPSRPLHQLLCSQRLQIFAFKKPRALWQRMPCRDFSTLHRRTQGRAADAQKRNRLSKSQPSFGLAPLL
jgi:hypothetical protein